MSETSPRTLDDVLDDARDCTLGERADVIVRIPVGDLAVLLAEIDRLTPRVITTAEEARRG